MSRPLLAFALVALFGTGCGRSHLDIDTPGAGEDGGREDGGTPVDGFVPFDSSLPDCGNGMCTDPGESCETCPTDCGTCVGCGDAMCRGGEDCRSCPIDCGVCDSCPDGACAGGEDCTSC